MADTPRSVPTSSSASPKGRPGTVFLVGAGPGDPGLLTLRAKECIEAADVLVYDYLANPLFLSYAKPGVEKIYAGKKAGDHALKQGDTNALLIEKARAGKTVTRLKGGDPFVFGRGGEEAEELVAAGIPFEIVPGISSTIAGPAYAGIPVTHRSFNTQLTIFTGHEDPTKGESTLDYAAIARAPGTKVMLMGVERMRAITGELIAAGADATTPIALVRWATTPRQQVITGTLATIADEIERTGFKAPAVAVIGGVVSLRETLRWFDRRPLFGKKVLVTRTRAQAGELSQQLAALGADVIELPTIRIEEPEDRLGFGELVQDAYKYEWLVFTSPNGVERFFTLFHKLYEDIRSIGGARIAAVGNGTAAKIREHHLAVDLVPKVMTGDGLLAALLKIEGGVDNRMFLVIRPEEVRNTVSAGLSKAGAIVDDAIAYRTVPETSDETGAQARFLEEGADVLTFASGSAVDHFLALNLPIPPAAKIASIGPVTSDVIKKHGLRVDAEATTHDIPGLVKAVRRLVS
jgi:uroporphyrinogen III methyltransferase/synthase